nr:hypothetical protein [uncultured Undibacterium sp.]
MKTKFSSLDSSLLELLTNRPSRLGEILALATIRDAALRINRRRAGVSPSESADITVNERLQALRQEGKLTYDPATSRWDGRSKNTNFPTHDATDLPL